ncbi:MAG: hypothetical protein ACOYD0_08660 [Candidatus Nanopelagicales bacterium]
MPEPDSSVVLDGKNYPAQFHFVHESADGRQVSSRYSSKGRKKRSLPTPPCTEGLKWVVPTTPITMSAAQTGELAAVYSDNIRPIQASDDRVLTENPK